VPIEQLRQGLIGNAGHLHGLYGNGMQMHLLLSKTERLRKMFGGSYFLSKTPAGLDCWARGK
jgi:hypothetical protein